MGEIWDIYDVNKQLTGRTMKRNDWNMKDGDYHLTVLGIIKRPDNTFLITQRVLTKAWAPGHWEVSGGACQAGETSFQAVCREVLEETGVDVSHADGGFEFSYRRDIHLQTEETAGFRFATAEEIKAIADRGEFLHYDSIRKVFE